MQGVGPGEGFQPGPEAVGDRKDYRRDVERPDRRGETGLPERVRSREDRVQRLVEGLPQLAGLPGVRQRQEPGGGRHGGGEPAEADSHGQRRAVHEHPARGRPRW
ncbi:hypothetical protein EYF80_066015 [Liparis tanakae]|uniref:Uncharacterized protein n=1 Tax=Liparis tanakae TaxID=230148 RepID=A0A4Z2E5D8_9TELE|nr:hypothetical protein EYF80_066015 [Liparis tanakae]